MALARKPIWKGIRTLGSWPPQFMFIFWCLTILTYITLNFALHLRNVISILNQS